MKKLTQDEYINKCIDVHNNKYDYSFTIYKKLTDKVKIFCKVHGIFLQNSKNHRDGQGCPRCSMPNYNLTKNEFINKCNNEKYDYSLILSKIVKSDDKISIIDKETFLVYQQLADNHRNGITPIKIEAISLKSKLKNIHNNKYEYFIDTETVYSTTRIKIQYIETNDIFYYRVDRHLQGMVPNKVTLNLFKIRSSKIHNNKYDYSLIKEIKRNSEKVDIICDKHGIFTQRVSNHMNLKDGCPKCVGVGKWNTKLLIEEFKKIHLNNFDYSLVKFINIDEKIDIICKEHGIFKQNIHKHLKGQGCKLCVSSSKGEDFVRLHLEEMKVKYIRQHSFDTCKFINKLSFDFYLPDLKTCIEFDGEQHFKAIDVFGGEKGYQLNVKRDKCKNSWCFENNIKLIRIKYNEVNKIKEILNSRLFTI